MKHVIEPAEFLRSFYRDQIRRLFDDTDALPVSFRISADHADARFAALRIDLAEPEANPAEPHLFAQLGDTIGKIEDIIFLRF